MTTQQRLKAAQRAWFSWYRDRLSRIHSGSDEDYTGYEQDLFDALHDEIGETPCDDDLEAEVRKHLHETRRDER